jgi:hypothetical protein
LTIWEHKSGVKGLSIEDREKLRYGEIEETLIVDFNLDDKTFTVDGVLLKVTDLEVAVKSVEFIKLEIHNLYTDENEMLYFIIKEKLD